MPWWSWVLIWVGLAALLVLVLVICAVLLFRKLMALGDAVSHLGDQIDAATAAGQRVPSSPAGTLPAIFQNPWSLSMQVEERRSERLLRRQRSRDRRVVRGKLFRNAPVTFEG